MIFQLKSWFLIFVVIWIRWTLPRVRIDQMMNLCWKWFVPLSFVAFILTARLDGRCLIPARSQLVISVATFATWGFLMVHFVRRVRYNMREVARRRST